MCGLLHPEKLKVVQGSNELPDHKDKEGAQAMTSETGGCKNQGHSGHVNPDGSLAVGKGRRDPARHPVSPICPPDLCNRHDLALGRNLSGATRKSPVPGQVQSTDHSPCSQGDPGLLEEGPSNTAAYRQGCPPSLPQV